MTTTLAPSRVIRLKTRTAMNEKGEQFAALKTHCQRIMVIRQGVAEYSIHADWDAAERSLNIERPITQPDPPKPAHISLEAIYYAVIDEQADVVIWVGRPLPPILRFFFTDPPAYISWRADIPVVVISASSSK